MRTIFAKQITELVEAMLTEMAFVVDPFIASALERAHEEEKSETGREVIADILENRHVAHDCRLPLCQDTGMVIAFAEIGQNVHIDGCFEDAVNDGVRHAYRGLRKSVVRDPLYDRTNTLDNAPAVIYTRLVPGDGFTIELTAKGFGSENMSGVRMCSPSEGEEGVRAFVKELVKKAGPNPCPPIVVGIGIGGTMDSAAVMAKRATMNAGTPNPDERYAALERAILGDINKLGIGPAGTGGTTTALAVSILTAPTHIAGMPVAVNICCHALRHERGSL